MGAMLSHSFRGFSYHNSVTPRDNDSEDSVTWRETFAKNEPDSSQWQRSLLQPQLAPRTNLHLRRVWSGMNYCKWCVMVAFEL
jgi:hypothetical protein